MNIPGWILHEQMSGERMSERRHRFSRKQEESINSIKNVPSLEQRLLGQQSAARGKKETIKNSGRKEVGEWGETQKK